MDIPPPVTDAASTPWDWGDLLDFTVDDQLTIPWDSDHPPVVFPEPGLPLEGPTRESSDRVRKRDPRLICSNFVAGRIPCACPEVDEKLEEEDGGTGKKRARTARARCQVPECEADISELKGYHRRHRVCLRCANASTVALDGQTKRYCQQCGKFHILADFDEGKRSCRRKLERHNNRRRRKPSDSRGAVEKEPQGDLLSEDVCDGEAGKVHVGFTLSVVLPYMIREVKWPKRIVYGTDSVCLSSQIAEREALLESEDGHISNLCSAPGSQNIHSDSVVSFGASGETQMDGEKDNSRGALSSSYGDNKSAYSSMCPTGRISFKLYDWNPAEFPRRLRHQIFQWLANMPVELEGYIRPGCTILTAFIAMPKFMWVKLYEDPVKYIHDFVVAPGNMLSGRGTLLVSLNNMIFRVMKDGTSVMKLKVEVQAPKLHYVHPTCFEAGKPMEFIACGSNLLQPKLRFLVSFAGKYLAYDYCVAFPHGNTEGDTACSFDHQLYKIYIPHTEPTHFGPAFIEVENESGLSNFIPILIGDKELCSEMKMVQRRIDASLCSEGSKFVTSSSLSDLCEVSELRQTAFSEFILDIAWLLKGLASENIQNILTTSQIERFKCLLNFLMHNESTIILEKMLRSMKIVMDKMEINSPVNDTSDADMGLFQKYMDHARDILWQKIQKSGGLVLHSGNPLPKGDRFSKSCSQNGVLSVVPITNQVRTPIMVMQIIEEGKLGVTADLTSLDRSETVPLLNREVVMNVNLMKEWPKKSCSHIFSNSVLGSRHLVFVIATTAVCFGICAVLLHPHQVGEFAVSLRRCLFDNS